MMTFGLKLDCDDSDFDSERRAAIRDRVAALLDDLIESVEDEFTIGGAWMPTPDSEWLDTDLTDEEAGLVCVHEWYDPGDLENGPQLYCRNCGIRPEQLNEEN